MKRPLAFFTAAAIALATGACHHQSEGPAEHAGKKIDNAAEDTKDAVKDTGHDVKRDLSK
ncbi:MAG: hypothetical protein M3O36_02945 [Myxococcota bacterium]|nr:hypothetical protein [Myxococcota bacterium]